MGARQPQRLHLKCFTCDQKRGRASYRNWRIALRQSRNPPEKEVSKDAIDAHHSSETNWWRPLRRTRQPDRRRRRGGAATSQLATGRARSDPRNEAGWRRVATRWDAPISPPRTALLSDRSWPAARRLGATVKQPEIPLENLWPPQPWASRRPQQSLEPICSLCPHAARSSKRPWPRPIAARTPTEAQPRTMAAVPRPTSRSWRRIPRRCL